MATITGDSGNNTLTGTNSADTVSGAAGNDVLSGGGGNDTLYGGGLGTNATEFTPAYGTKLTGASGNVTGTNGNPNFTYTSTSNENNLTSYNGPANNNGTLNGYWVGNGDQSAGTSETHTHAFSQQVDSVRILFHSLDQGETLAILLDGVAVNLNTLIANGEATFTDASGTYSINGSGQLISSANNTSAKLNVGTLVINRPFTSVSLQNTYGSLYGNGTVYELYPNTNPVFVTEAQDGNDTLNGGDGNDTIFGKGGNDQLNGDAGNDSLDGGAGNDTFVLSDGYGTDTILGGETSETTGDTITVAALTSGVVVTLTGPDAGTVANGSNSATFSEIENFTLTGFADTFNGALGTSAFNVDGGAGNDSLTGGSGNDTLAGGTGNDTLNGGAGNDSLTGGDGNDTFTLSDGFGTDAIFGGNAGETTGDVLNMAGLTAGVTVVLSATENGTATVGANVATFGDVENFILTAQNDIFNGAAATGALTIDGGAGNDSLTGGSGNDTLTGGLGNDTLNGGAGADSLTGGDGDDTFALSDGFGSDTIVGGETGEVGGDVLNLSALTTGATVVLSASEAGTAAAGASTASFSQIENFILTAQADSFNGAAGSSAINVGGGAGNDSLTGGSGNDTLAGGIGNDTLNGGGGADTIFGGDGADTISGGAGNDALFGGSDGDRFTFQDGFGADTVQGGEGGSDFDRLDFGGLTSGVSITFSGNEAGTAVNGANSIAFSQIEALTLTAQNDTLIGSGDTTGLNVDAGAGNDSLLGGSGNDGLTGGTGADTLSGGIGADTLLGGDDADVFRVDVGDSVDGGEGAGSGTDADTLDLRNWGKALTDIAYDPLNHENGVVTFYDAFGGIIGTMAFQNVENVIPCFTPGTMIATDRGPVAVEKLAVDDRVLTRDTGYQRLRWVGSKAIDAARLGESPELQPILIRQGALGDGLPLADMMVSPQHRMLLSGPRAEMLFGDAEVLASALHLTDLPGVARVAVQSVTYLHLLFDQHEIICANGAWTESFQPGDHAMAGLGAETCAELFAIFPELADPEGRRGCPAARLSLKGYEVRALLAA